ncbi:MAG: hypothetical protein ACFFEF_15520, partial [Candidatus Thorarchaeota archaeon]
QTFTKLHQPACRREYMILDLDEAFVKLANPRMSAGLMILHSLLNDLKGEPVEPREVRETVDKLMSKRNVSKQSITNAAIRLQTANIIDRKENKYVVNYGYLISLLVNTMIEMNRRILDLEEDVHALKTSK